MKLYNCIKLYNEINGINRQNKLEEKCLIIKAIENLFKTYRYINISIH